MSNIADKLLCCVATTAEEAFLEAMGLASHGGAYEPEMPEEAKAYKTAHTSKLETIFDKIAR
jgi:hypothetical protein